MGAQSILKKDICSLREEQTDKILKHSKEQQLKRRFDLGKRCPENTIRKDILLQRMLNSENCEVLEYINENMVHENIFTKTKYKDCDCKDKKSNDNQPEVFSSEFSEEFE